MTFSGSHCSVEAEPIINHSFFDSKHTASFFYPTEPPASAEKIGAVVLIWSCLQITHSLPAAWTKHSTHTPPSQKGSNSEIVMHFSFVKHINSYPNEQLRVVKTAHREMQQLWWPEGWREILKHSEKCVQTVLPRNITKNIGLQWGGN